MKNKPVAWIAVGDNTSVFFDLDCALAIDENPTPLYTHPAKTLTDEEDTECQFCKQGCIRCDARKLLTDEEIAKLADDILGYQIYGYKESGVYDFARAILRKAQEE